VIFTFISSAILLAVYIHQKATWYGLIADSDERYNAAVGWTIIALFFMVLGVCSVAF
jgi:hypothetical protein